MSVNVSKDFILDVVGIVLYAQLTQRIAVFRRKEGDSGAGHWEFPGGKIEGDETHEAALQREINEELGVSIDGERLKCIGDVLHQYPQRKIRLFLYLYVVENEDMKFSLTDHDLHQWVSAQDILAVSLSPADLALVPRVLESLK